MCGITSILGISNHNAINNMMNAISHRGPDSRGIYEDEHLVFGHLRLAIQDLSDLGHQPMISEDERFILILNGEIYNHWNIRKNIEHKYKFKSTSDTETVLNGFAEYGIKLFAMLNGIFAMAVYDKFEKEVYIVRDQFGIKPLYYSLCNHTFIFSSEIKSLCKYPDFDFTIDEEALAHYIYHLWSPGENTGFKNCKKLLSGHYIKINLHAIDDFKTIKYYELPFNGKYSEKDEKQLIEELDERLTKAVERQLLSDVPIGFFLSGGLDSSLIVAIAKKLKPKNKITCFTIDTNLDSSKEGFSEDLPYAKRVAKYLDVDLDIIKADIDIIHDFDNMIYHLDEPQADAAPLNVYNICKAARDKGIIVLLGGTAGDDLFSGYRRHQSIYYYQKLKHLPQYLKASIAYVVGKLGNFNPFNRRLNKLFSIYKYKRVEKQFASLYGWLDQSRVKKLFKNKISVDLDQKFIDGLSLIPDEKSLLNQLLFLETKYFLTDHNLNYTDKMSMAHGIEVRVPYLDLELVEFSTTIPPELKMKGKETKYILKKLAERYLPNDVIYRSKSGFGAPVRDWITKDLKSKIWIEFNEDHNESIFNRKEVLQLIKDNQNNKIDASYSVWALLAIKSWIEQFKKK